MSKEKDISDRILMGQSSLQRGDQNPLIYDVYQLDPDLPESNKKREVCFDHIRQGVALELMGDFQLAGIHYPEINQPQEITTQLSCKGVSCVLKRCGLIIEQYDNNGKKLTEMRSVE